MAKDRNKAVPAVYLLLRKGEDILLMRRQGSGYYDGWYSVPAGHVEAGELPLGGLIREAGEELGIAVDPKDAKLVHTMYRTKHDETGDRVDMFFVVSKWSGEITNVEPHKCGDIRWFPVKELPENVMHHVRDAIKDVELSIQYSELDLPHITLNPPKP
ncbi:NUDIX domain-containing protein [Candidatus Parcubacteria bacterium]|nr:NUDIX domain-containing protein [Candidatus Parcubacteria bacterium]